MFTKNKGQTSLSNTTLIDMQAFVDKLIFNIYFIKVVNLRDNKQKIIDVLSKQDMQGEKLLKLATKLKDNAINNNNHSNLICFANTKLSLGQMITLRCLTVAGKSYLVEKECFEQGYCATIPETILK